MPALPALLSWAVASLFDMLGWEAHCLVCCVLHRFSLSQHSRSMHSSMAVSIPRDAFEGGEGATTGLVAHMGPSTAG